MVKKKYVKIILCAVVCGIGLWLLITKCVQLYYDKELKRELTTSTIASDNLPGQLIEDAVLRRIQEKYIKSGGLDEMLEAMTEVERNVFVTCYFERKVRSGGLCSFLLEYPELAPYIIDALEAVKAEPYKKLLETFIKQNHIDLEHIIETQVFDMYDYFLFYQKYPFDEFDNRFKGLEHTEEKDLGDYITEYIYANMVSL